MCFDGSGTYDIECSRKVASERKVAGAIRSLVNARSLNLECTRVLHEGFLVPVLLHGSGTMIWSEKDRSWVKAYKWTTSEVC